ncbi:MAG: hypothetical protein MK212_08840 [Saprospiraceae bacterium]|nr:hypothetical protein [Saprospiraceae bacterium]
MKNFFKGSALMLLFAFVFTSCSKDQALTNNVAGTDWDVVSYTVDGVDQLASLGDHPQMYFNTCALGTSNMCTGYTSAEGKLSNFDYLIEGKGTELHLIWEAKLGGAAEEYFAEITNDGKKEGNFTFTYTNNEGQVIEYQLGFKAGDDHDHDHDHDEDEDA